MEHTFHRELADVVEVDSSSNEDVQDAILPPDDDKSFQWNASLAYMSLSKLVTKEQRPEVGEVDFMQLNRITLLRYKRFHQLPGGEDVSDVELANQVSDHFRTLVVDKKDVLKQFLGKLNDANEEEDEDCDASPPGQDGSVADELVHLEVEGVDDDAKEDYEEGEESPPQQGGEEELIHFEIESIYDDEEIRAAANILSDMDENRSLFEPSTKDPVAIVSTEKTSAGSVIPAEDEESFAPVWAALVSASRAVGNPPTPPRRPVPFLMENAPPTFWPIGDYREPASWTATGAPRSDSPRPALYRSESFDIEANEGHEHVSSGLALFNKVMAFIVSALILFLIYMIL